MAPQRKREPRENNFHNVGVQGRKTGITLADRGVYDEHGLEPISGIFSSPEKSPPKRGSTLTVTASESMDLQESSIPDLTTSRQILRSSRTHLPPPRSRSPKKTALGSSPRRQSSMAPRASSADLSSPPQTTFSTARRLDFGQDESSLNETPALSGSGARRGKRSSVYDIPEEDSPTHEMSDLVDRSALPEGVSELQDSIVLNGATEESFVAQIGDDTMPESVSEDSTHVEETEPAPASVKGPAARGRKRKSHVLESAEEDNASVASRKKGPAVSQNSQTKKSGKKNVSRQDPKSRRFQRVSDVTDIDVSVENASADTSMQISEVQEAPVASKRRGRPPHVQPESGKENSVPIRLSKLAPIKEKSAPEFKKPSKPVGRPKSGTEPKNKVESKKAEKASQLIADDSGKLVDVHGNPLSKKDIEQMSTASFGSRYGRGRHLSVFREMDPEAVARVGRTGRHRVAPIDFWKNDRIAYDTDGSMTSIVKNQAPEPERKSYKGTGARGRKKMSSINEEEEEEVDLDPWEEDDGMLVGNYRDFDPVMDVTSTTIIEDTIAWAEKGIVPSDVPDGSFKYTKLASVGSFFNWGLIELRADQMKRTKNSRKMHMVFNVQSGTVEVKVHENEFTVHRRGIWQVPRGNTYSIRNVGSGTARVFFAQAMQTTVQDDE